MHLSHPNPILVREISQTWSDPSQHIGNWFNIAFNNPLHLISAGSCVYLWWFTVLRVCSFVGFELWNTVFGTLCLGLSLGVILRKRYSKLHTRQYSYMNITLWRLYPMSTSCLGFSCGVEKLSLDARWKVVCLWLFCLVHAFRRNFTI